MKLVKLVVEQFQAIESAEVEFGPGLNVLFGPNDLGKSSLAWAIRAVLLLQHNSAAHERFVSWYGDQHPKVTLTFTDRDGGFWRVAKTFGTASGRSLLESSRDGVSFRTVVTGRQVDEKLRAMLGWGIPAPGGAGGTRGIPESFLAQVLLAEQDSVRKVLFETSLDRDGDESGRSRLVEALGALAQDPLFKTILEGAQERVDLAFTPKGQRKRGAGSPFVAIGARIKDLQRERDELDAKLKETVAAELRIRELNAQLEAAIAQARDADAALTDLTGQQGLAAKQQAVREQLDTQRARLVQIAALVGSRDEAIAAVATLLGQRDEREAALTTARAAVVAAAQARQRASDDFAALTDPKGASEQRRQALETAQRAAVQELNDATRDTERAAASLQVAEQRSRGLREAFLERTRAEAGVRGATARIEEAAVPVQRGKAELDAAQERLREATSADAVRARDLRRSELTNHRLVREQNRVRHEAALQAARERRGLITRRDEAVQNQATLESQLAAARREHASAATAIGASEAERAQLAAVERYGQLCKARGTVEAAKTALVQAEELTARAQGLRTREASLRARIRTDLPAPATIGALRGQREAVRLAEARLGGGISVTVRPRRALLLQLRSDGVARPAERIAAAVTVSASRRLEVGLDDLVDIEVSAGEASARDAARDARAAWDADGAAVLRGLGLETLESLEQLRAASDAATVEANDLGRQCEQAEARAAQQRASVELRGLAADVGALEAQLGAIDEGGLAVAVAAHGADWPASVRAAASRADALIARATREADAHHTAITRLEAQREHQLRVIEELATEVSRRAAVHPGVHPGVPPGVPGLSEEQLAGELARLDAELTQCDRELAALAGAADDQEQVARKRLGLVQASVAAAESQRAIAQDEHLKARELAVQAATKHDAAQLQAAEHDVAGVWGDAIVTGEELDLGPWRAAAASAATRKVACADRCTQLARELEGLAGAREHALQTAREQVATAERSARAAQDLADAAVAAQQGLQQAIAAKQVAAAEADAAVAKADAGGTEAAIGPLAAALAALGPPITPVHPHQVAAQQALFDQLGARAKEHEDQLALARGGLQQVGGAIVRERHQETLLAITAAENHEHEVITEYEAWRLLVTTLHESESTQGAHLGRALAAPVSQRFRELTGGRYGPLDLGPHLDAEGLRVAGELRSIAALSAGTQDQLATLLRLCVAEQLKSSIVLDDHLSQSDPTRVEWFNSILRTAAQQIQIILITCRPGELLGAGEWPATGDATKSAAAGLMRSADLTKLIRRL